MSCLTSHNGEIIRDFYYGLFDEEGIPGTMFCRSRDNSINVLKNNPVVQENISSNEIAELIGNSDVFGIASDITEATGYEFRPSFLRQTAHSFYEVANEFAK